MRESCVAVTLAVSLLPFLVLPVYLSILLSTWMPHGLQDMASVRDSGDFVETGRPPNAIFGANILLGTRIYSSYSGK